MRNLLYITISVLFYVLSSCAAVTAQEWIPVEEFPLLFPRMEKATIHFGQNTDKSILLPCNIHISTAKKGQLLYYINANGMVMETKPGNINKVIFPDGEYVPVNNKYFGKVVHQDSCGQVIRVWDTDLEALLKDKNSTLGTSTKANLEMMRWFVPNASDVQIPMKVTYYFVFRNKLFEITEKNILKAINPNRRHEYRVFTRSEQILSTSFKSVMKIWNNFFVNY